MASGFLPTEVGRTDSRSDEPDYSHPSTRPGDDDNETSIRGSDSQNKQGYTRDTEKGGAGGNSGDSTMGKMMERAGGVFKNEKLRERGEEKRREAGALDNDGNY